MTPTSDRDWVTLLAADPATGQSHDRPRLVETVAWLDRLRLSRVRRIG